MNAISLPRHLSKRVAAEDTAVFSDVGDCIRSWGMRGILSGGLFGFALGGAFVAIPFSANVLSFGPIGTLLIGTVECAVIAGGFGALAAALYGKGVLRSHTTRFERTLVKGRRSADINWRDEESPMSEWPTRWVYPGLKLAPHALTNTDVEGHGIYPRMPELRGLSAVTSSGSLPPEHERLRHAAVPDIHL